MKFSNKKFAMLPFLFFIIWIFIHYTQSTNRIHKSFNNSGIPVEVSPIENGPIHLLQTYSGTLEAHSSFTVSPKIGGRVEKILVHISDTIERGSVVAILDDDEFIQELTQAQANLAVAQANLAQAQNAFEISNRELERKEILKARGVASDAELDTAKTEQMTQKTRLKVTEAELNRAQSSVQSAQIQRDYTQVRADWSVGDIKRIVAERYIDEGQIITANTPLLKIVELNPIIGVIYVTEKEYSKLKIDQPISILTDAYPNERFMGVIRRIAPIFKETSRQARIELEIPNQNEKLKPGMFIRTIVELDYKKNAMIVPDQAITFRENKQGVFLVNEVDQTVSWQPVQLGIREGKRIEIIDSNLEGNVVTLGQQMLQDGSKILIISSQPIPKQSPNP